MNRSEGFPQTEDLVPARGSSVVLLDGQSSLDAVAVAAAAPATAAAGASRRVSF